MALIIEDRWQVFLVMTVIIGGSLAFMTGRGLASRWRPMGATIVYVLLLGAALRFFHFALFQGQLLSIHYFLTDTAVLAAAALLGYRLTFVGQMVARYPWAYEKTGPFGYRAK